MAQIYNAVSEFTGWLWGIPILIILIGGGILMTIVIGGIQFTKFGFIMKHTLFSLFDKEEQQRKRALGISPAQAVTAALGTTIGTWPGLSCMLRTARTAPPWPTSWAFACWWP